MEKGSVGRSVCNHEVIQSWCKKFSHHSGLCWSSVRDLYLVTEGLGGNEGDFLNDPLVGVEIEGELGVVLLDDDTSCLLDSFGSDATHDSEDILEKIFIRTGHQKIGLFQH